MVFPVVLNGPTPVVKERSEPETVGRLINMFEDFLMNSLNRYAGSWRMRLHVNCECLNKLYCDYLSISNLFPSVIRSCSAQTNICFATIVQKRWKFKNCFSFNPTSNQVCRQIYKRKGRKETALYGWLAEQRRFEHFRTLFKI